MATLGRRSIFSICNACKLLKKCVPKNVTTMLNTKKTLFSSQFHSIYKREFHTTPGPLWHEGRQEWDDPKSEDEIVRIVYIRKNGDRMEINGKTGDNAMYLAHRHEIEMEGACEASLACCTCHVYVKDEYFDKLPEPSEKEEDMLDMAPFLKVNSRLGCQITLSKDLDGIELELPQATRNFYVDGHVPAPH